jgi:hypothetical protein
MTNPEAKSCRKDIQAAARRHDDANLQYARLVAEGVDDDTAAKQSGIEATSDALTEMAERIWSRNDLLPALHAIRDVLEVGLPVSDGVLFRIAGRYVARAA